MDNQEVSNTILEALLEKLGERRVVCPFSGPDTQWNVLGQTTILPAVKDPSNASILTNKGYPMALVQCTDCGYTMLVNLLALGVANKLGISEAASDEQ